MRVGARGQAAAIRAVHRHRHDGGVVEIGIMRVGVLEGPAARPDVGTPSGPVALHVEDLERLQPVERRAAPALRPRRPPASISAWAASAVSQTGDRQGWQ